MKSPTTMKIDSLPKWFKVGVSDTQMFHLIKVPPLDMSEKSVLAKANAPPQIGIRSQIET